MEIKITPAIDAAELFGDLYNDTNVFDKYILDAYELACIEAIKSARNQPSPPATMKGLDHRPTYIDLSRHLRQSLGYAVYYNGEVWRSSYQRPTTKNIIAKAAADMTGYAIGCVLIAGEKYATYVEKRGYNVLTAQYIGFQKILDKYLKEAFVKIQHDLNNQKWMSRT